VGKFPKFMSPLVPKLLVGSEKVWRRINGMDILAYLLAKFGGDPPL